MLFVHICSTTAVLSVVYTHVLVVYIIHVGCPPTPTPTHRFKGMSTDDFLVYQTIEARQNKGIWTKDIKGATNIHGPALTRILKV